MKNEKIEQKKHPQKTNLKFVFWGVFLLFFSIYFLLFTNSVSAATLSKPPNNLGLVGYWSFNEGTGTVATDFSGTGNNGAMQTFSAPPTASSGWTDGPRGKALNFDGTSDYINVPDSPSLRLTGNMTISAWVKIQSCPGSYAFILEKGDTDNDNYGLYLNSSCYPNFEYTDSGSQYRVHVQSVGVGAVPGQWTMLTFVYDDTNDRVRFYTNGVMQQNIANANSLLGNQTSDLWIGRQNYGANYYYHTGGMDEVRIYNRALTDTEVASLYSSGSVRRLAPTNLGLLAYWSFNEGTSTIAGDFSGNGNHGTLQSFANPATATSGWGDGRFGSGLNFDGTNDYISTTRQYSNPQTFTISGWFKTTSANGRKIVGFENVQTGEGGASYDRHIYMGTDGRIRFGWYPGSIVTVTSTNTLNDGKWHHFLATHNGSTGQLFIDGVSQGTNTGSPQSYSGYWRVGSYKLATWTNGGDGYFDGAIDDIRIYDRVLSAEERNTLFLAGGETKINTSPVNRLTEGLLGYWTFDGKHTDWGSTFKILDVSGNGFHGTTTVATSSAVIGKVGQALSFNGAVGDYVSLGTSPSLTPSSAITMAAWVKSTDGVLAQRIIDKDTYFLRIQLGTNLRCSIDTGTATSFTTTSNPIVPNTWQHVVCTWDGQNIRIYVDGLPVVDSPVAKTGTMTDNGLQLRIGNSPSGTLPFFGVIDDVRLYSRALSAEEVKQLYLMGK